jgi:hypothetical protein
MPFVNLTSTADAIQRRRLAPQWLCLRPSLKTPLGEADHRQHRSCHPALGRLAMLFTGSILEWTGTALQVFTVVLGVTQIALGLQIITHSLSLIGVFVERVD